MRRRIHVAGGNQDKPSGATENDNLSQEITGTNAPPVDDSVHIADPPAAEEGSAGFVDGGDGAGVGDVADAQQEEIQALRAEIERLTKERDEERSQHLRTLADFQNFRRRKEEERGADRQFANRELILGMLPVLDNFERALAASEKNQSYEALIDGVKLTLRQFHDFLAKNGVSAIESVGKEFDPNYHEAVMRVEDSTKPENTVVEELQRGYSINDRVLRPSMVKVARNG